MLYVSIFRIAFMPEPSSTIESATAVSQAAFGGGAAGAGHDVDAVLVGELQDVDDVLRAARHHDGGGKAAA